MIPVGTNLTPAYIGIGMIIWIVELVIASKESDAKEEYLFVAALWTLLSAFWPVLIALLGLFGFFYLVWRIFNK